MQAGRPSFANLLLISISMALALAAAEIGLRYFQVSHEDVMTERRETLLAAYSAEERDTSRQFWTRAQGADCVKREPPAPLAFHPRFGWHKHHLDKPCARKLFAEGEISAVFLGGSAMANWEAPNHLTTIVEQIHRRLPHLRSINLSESAARSTNELVRLVLEVVDLGPDYVVFLDGYNEFSSIRYGGDPEADFYWSAGVWHRIHAPFFSLFDRVVARSKVLQLIFLTSGLVDSPRTPKQAPAISMVRRAAEIYTDDTEKIDRICAAYEIRCLFLLQPHLYSKANPTNEERSLEAYFGRLLPGGEGVLDAGYKFILAATRVPLVDLRDAFDGLPDIYFDEVHFNKLGSVALGDRIAETIAPGLAKGGRSTP